MRHYFDAMIAEGAPFVVELAHFNGPLDLLLTLIRDEQIDIYDIPIARVAEQFLVRLHSLGLDDAADYLDMAARLLRIKAQLLLPHPEGDEAWEDPRAELVRRLLEYQQVREVVDILDARGEARRNQFARTVPVRPGDPVPQNTVLSVSMSELLAAVDRVLRSAVRPIVHTVVPRALDVEGALRAVRALLAERSRASWRDLLAAGSEPWRALSFLLALLEMARLGECIIRQAAPFADVEIRCEPAGQAA
jgi:segregation and condensation protein A